MHRPRIEDPGAGEADERFRDKREDSSCGSGSDSGSAGDGGYGPRQRCRHAICAAMRDVTRDMCELLDDSCLILHV